MVATLADGGKLAYVSGNLSPSQLTHLTFQQKIWKAFWNYLDESRSMICGIRLLAKYNFCGCNGGKSSSNGCPAR